MYKPQLPTHLSLGHIYHQTYRQLQGNRPKLEMIRKLYYDCQLVCWYRL